MGKFAQYQKRGSSKGQGTLPAPILTDFTPGGPGATSIAIGRNVSIPAGADQWGVLVQPGAGGAPQGTSPVQSGTPITVTGLTTLTPYKVRIAWFLGTVRVSEWSDFKTFTTA